jgi:hypothetical protein
MTDFYRALLRFKEERIAASYLSTLRHYCRRDGERVHPYYWAPFIFIDGEYQTSMPW